jgi:hypothetical protein
MNKPIKPGTRVKYSLWRWSNNDFNKRCKYIGRYINCDGAYNRIMRGPGTFSMNAKNVIELYPEEFEIV